MASPLWILVTRAGIWLRALSFMTCSFVGDHGGYIVMAARLTEAHSSPPSSSLSSSTAAGGDLGRDRWLSLDAYSYTVAHEVDRADLSGPGVLVLVLRAAAGIPTPPPARRRRGSARWRAAPMTSWPPSSRSSAVPRAVPRSRLTPIRSATYAGSRPGRHLGGRPGLHDPAVLDHDHPVAERHGVEQVVGDQHVRRARTGAGRRAAGGGRRSWSRRPAPPAARRAAAASAR